MEHTRLIAFVYDTDEDIKKKYDYLVGKLGTDRVSYSDRIEFERNESLPRMVSIMCTFEEFQEIKFQLNLTDAYI